MRQLPLWGLVIIAGGMALVGCGQPRTPDASAQTTTQLTQGIAFFEAKLRADPGNPMIAGHLASRYVRRFGQSAQWNDVTRAEELARMIVGRSLDPGAAAVRLSNVVLMQHRFAEAMQWARFGLNANPEDAAAWGALLEAALAAGAVEVADSAVEHVGRRSLAGLVQRALWLDARGRTAAAIPLERRACRLLERSGAPRASRAWCLTELAALEHRTGGAGAFRARLHEALAIFPGYRGAVEGLAWLDFVAGRYHHAETAYRGLATDAHPDIYLRLAELADARRDPAAATQWRANFERVALRPDREALYGPAIALYWLGRSFPGTRDSALAVATREVARRPTADSWDLLAWVLHATGRDDAAMEASRRAADLVATPTGGWQRGAILVALGHADAGRRLQAEAEVHPSLLRPDLVRQLWRKDRS